MALQLCLHCAVLLDQRSSLAGCFFLLQQAGVEPRLEAFWSVLDELRTVRAAIASLQR